MAKSLEINAGSVVYNLDGKLNTVRNTMYQLARRWREDPTVALTEIVNALNEAKVDIAKLESLNVNNNLVNVYKNAFNELLSRSNALAIDYQNNDWYKDVILEIKYKIGTATNNAFDYYYSEAEDAYSQMIKYVPKENWTKKMGASSWHYGAAVKCDGYGHDYVAKMERHISMAKHAGASKVAAEMSAILADFKKKTDWDNLKDS